MFEDTEDQRRGERLQEAVDNGDITAEQKTLIENKMQEMEAKIEEINNQQMTASQRQEALQDLREECDSWANDNDIPRMFMMIMGERGGRGGMMMGGGMKGMGFE